VAFAGSGAYGESVPFLGHKFKHEREWEEVRASAQDDLVALGDDIRALDVDIQMPDVSADAKQRYEQALEAYQRASEIFDRAKHPEDLAPMTETLEEGRYAMAYAKALLEGKDPPERRAPCFFDPRHGPSTEDVEWAPPGGSPRPRTWSGRPRAARPAPSPRAQRTRSASGRVLLHTGGKSASTGARPTTGTPRATSAR
jgi:hypothetical protein